jgi:hypothetical protein
MSRLEETRAPITAGEIVARSGLRGTSAALAPVPHQRDFVRIASWLQHFTGVDLSSLLRNGADLGFTGDRRGRFAPNHRSARENSDFVDSQITAYIAAGIVAGPFANGRPFAANDMACSPLGVVPKWPSGHRLILDLSASGVNAAIDVPKFKYSRLDDFLKGVTRETYLCKRDVDQAYLRVALRPEDVKLCCFYWRRAYYCYLRLPFGAKSAPFLFCAIADAAKAAFIARWSSVFEFVLASYADDSFARSESEDDLLAIYTLWGAVLAAIGLTPSLKPDKAVGPCKALGLLGVHVDITSGFLSLPQLKRDKWFPQISAWLANPITRKDLERLCGQLCWLCFIQPLCRAFVQPFRDVLYADASRRAWSAAGVLHRSLHEIIPDEAHFVSELLRTSSCRRSLFSDGTDERVSVFSDAAWSTQRAGAATSDGEVVAYDASDLIQFGLITDINELECYGVLRAALHWATHRVAVNTRLCLFSDNTGTVGWIKRGAVPRRPFLNRLLQQLAMCAAQRSLTIVCAHVPGRRNRVADAISRNRPIEREFWDELVAFQEAAALAGSEAE